MKEVIKTDSAPCAVGPYSQAVRVGNTLYASGQVAIDPTTNKVVEGDVSVQAAQCLKNVQAVLAAAGFAITDVAKVTVFITNMADFPLVNEEYKKVFQEPYPARSCVGVASLPLGVSVEIEVIAVKND